jgi:drug/metabolite transporter (DMT)-like permease
MGSLDWAVGLSVLSAVSYAAAAVVQERLAAAGHRGLSRWAASLGLTGVGAGLHVIALDFGTVGVVQALGTLTLLFALPIAAARTHAPIEPAAWRDAGLTVAGLAGVMALSSTSGGSDVLDGDVARYLAIGTVGGAAGHGAAAGFTASPLIRSLLLAAGSGAAFAMASVFSKALLSSFSIVALLFVALFAVGGYLLGQLSYRGAGLAAPLAMVSVANPVLAAVVGIAVFGEGFRLGFLGAVLVMVAGVVAAVGVVGLSRRTVAPDVVVPDDASTIRLETHPV